MIEPKYHTVDSLFSHRVFRIPHYQRFYSWQTRQRKDLFDDLRDLHSKSKKSDRHHFMATIVCFRTGESQSVKSDEYQVFELVDGQQRITTLIILLKCMELRLKDEDERAKVGRILVKDDKNLLLLQTNNSNQHILNNFLREGTIPSATEITTHADKNLSMAIAESQFFLDEWIENGNDLLELLKITRNRIGLVVYDTDDEHAVYTVFECLNSRGLPVDWLDKTKSMLMGAAFGKAENSAVAKTLIDELNSIWGNIFDRISTYQVPGHEVLRIAATLFVGISAGKPLSAIESIDKFRETCVKSSSPTEISNWILKVTTSLVSFHEKPQLRVVTDILHARMLAVAIELADYLDKDDRYFALQQWERVTFRIFGLAKKDSRTKVGDFTRLSVLIIKNPDGENSFKSVIESLKELGEDFQVYDIVDVFLDEFEYSGYEEKCRYLLWKYEEFLAKEMNADISQELRADIWNERKASQTVEHVLPQSLPNTGQWRNKFSDKQHEKYVHRLGNLILLSPGHNSEAGQKAFKEKKIIYKRTQGLRLVAEILSLRVWSGRAIDKREARLKQFIVSEFGDIP